MRLSVIDAFFVAYQQRSGASMQLGTDVELRGALRRDDLVAAMEEVVSRWPQLGQRAKPGLLGLRWSGAPIADDMVFGGADGGPSLEDWRNVPLEPIEAPPFQVLWRPGEDDHHTVSFRAHHAVADGEAFFAVVGRFLEALAAGPADAEQRSGLPVPARPDRTVWPPRLRDLPAMWRHQRWLARESRLQRGARVAAESYCAGPIDTCERMIGADVVDALGERARELGVTPTWLGAAAWLRALHRWNVEQGAGERPLVSLEVPVSLRRSDAAIGNRVAPLLLFVDASEPATEVATDLQRQLRDGVRQSAHRAVPFWSGPAAWLPWWLFRRVAVKPTTTGFATTHYTWLARPSDPVQEMAERSDGRLALLAQRSWTPVCLKMGIALLAVAWPGHVQLGVTYRRAALPSESAARIADLLVEELALAAGSGANG